MKLSQLGEFGLIERLARFLPKKKDVVVGIGDDAAVLRRDERTYSLLTCDALVEKIHFTLTMPARQIGAKAMSVNLSDIAAMGGVPQHAVVTLGVRPGVPVRFYDELYRGIQKAAAPFGVTVVGGDTVSSPGGVFVNIALTGWVEKKHCALRRGARVGDAIVVTGALGGSFCGKHLTFKPRVEEARFLVRHFDVGAMIDLSDGLAGDLRHILKQSRVGARLNLAAIPVSRHVHATRFEEKIKRALCDGEDYELLAMLPKKEAQKAVAAFERQKGFPPLTMVGEIIPASRGLRCVAADGKEKELKLYGYRHF